MIRFPKDIELLPQFKHLSRLVGGRVQAFYLLFKLWIELTYQVTTHRNRPGIFDRELLVRWQAELELDGMEKATEAVAHLLTSKWLAVDSNENWFCEQFAQRHQDLDWRLIPLRQRDAIEFAKKRKNAEKAFRTVEAAIPPSAWIAPDGSRIRWNIMQRCYVLIRLVDDIVGNHNRKEFTTGLFQSAYELVSTWTQWRLKVVVMRLMKRYRFRSTLPATTEGIFANWDRVTQELEPIQGYTRSGRIEKGQSLTGENIEDISDGEGADPNWVPEALIDEDKVITYRKPVPRDLTAIENPEEHEKLKEIIRNASTQEEKQQQV